MISGVTASATDTAPPTTVVVADTAAPTTLVTKQADSIEQALAITINFTKIFMILS